METNFVSTVKKILTGSKSDLDQSSRLDLDWSRLSRPPSIVLHLLLLAHPQITNSHENCIPKNRRI